MCGDYRDYFPRKLKTGPAGLTAHIQHGALILQ